MEYFAGYGFTKSHSTAYAYLAYQTAYLKANYPRHFAAALLTIEAANTDKLALYIGECRDRGIAVLPPDINESQLHFTVVPEGVRFGLTAIKGLGEGAIRVDPRRARAHRARSRRCISSARSSICGSSTSACSKRSSSPAPATRSIPHGVPLALGRAQAVRRRRQRHRARRPHAARSRSGPGRSVRRRRDEGERADADPPARRRAVDRDGAAGAREGCARPVSERPSARSLRRRPAHLRRHARSAISSSPSCRRPPTARRAACSSRTSTSAASSPASARSRPRRAIAWASSRSKTRRARSRSSRFPSPSRASRTLIENGALVAVRGTFERDEESSRMQATEMFPLESLRERLSKAVRIRMNGDCTRQKLEALWDLLAGQPGRPAGGDRARGRCATAASCASAPTSMSQIRVKPSRAAAGRGGAAVRRRLGDAAMSDPMPELLEFEEPIGVLLKEIEALSMLPETEQRRQDIARLEQRIRSIRGELYSRLTPWQRVLVARHPSRPTTLDYIERLFTDFVEIHGDRRFADDHAIVCGMARYRRRGDPRRRPPEGQRHQAEDLPQLRLRAARGLSQGAARDADGAEVRPRRSSASSIRRRPTRASSRRSAASPRRSPSTCARWRCSPCRSIVVVHGEGGSGGALGIAVGDRILMHEFAIYSVIPPEGCAAILWRDSGTQGRGRRGAEDDGARICWRSASSTRSSRSRSAARTPIRPRPRACSTRRSAARSTASPRSTSRRVSSSGTRSSARWDRSGSSRSQRRQPR